MNRLNRAKKLCKVVITSFFVVAVTTFLTTLFYPDAIRDEITIKTEYLIAELSVVMIFVVIGVVVLMKFWYGE